MATTWKKVLVNGGALGTPASGNASNLSSFPTLNQATTGQAGSVANALTAGAGITGTAYNGGTAYTWTHADTSSQSSSDNSGNNFVQDIALDTYGHVTSITAAGASVGDTNQSAFATVSVSGQSNVVADAVSDTLTFAGAGTMTITTSAGSDLVTFTGADSYSAHENISAASSSDNSGETFIQDLTIDSNGHVTGLATATSSSGDANESSFKTFSVSGQSNVVADTTTDTMTLVGAGTMAITTAAGSDTITFTGTDSYAAHENISGGTTSNNSGSTFLQDITIDGNGHVTAVGTGAETYTSHVAVSQASSSDNSGNTFVQDLTIDSNGHVTGLGTGTASGFYTDSSNSTYWTTNTARTIGNSGATLTVAGSLTVEGATTFIDSTTLRVEDKNIELAKIGTPTSANASGGGITILTDETADPVLIWDKDLSATDVGGWKFYQDGTANYVRLGGNFYQSASPGNLSNSFKGMIWVDSDDSEIYISV